VLFGGAVDVAVFFEQLESSCVLTTTTARLDEFDMFINDRDAAVRLLLFLFLVV
jgi:hypothetical protein